MRGTLVTVVAAAFLAVAAPAASAEPFQIGSGDKPSVAVDENGDAHFSWNEESPGLTPDVLHYCKVPKGGSACALERTFAPQPPNHHGPTHVLTRESGEVVVLTHRCCNPDATQVTYALRSLDGGTTFAQPVEIGNVEPGGDAAFGPGQFTISLVSDTVTRGLLYQAARADGPRETAEARLNDGAPSSAVYDGSIGFVNQETPLVAFGDHDDVYYRIYNGGSNPNQIANWGPPVKLDSGDETRAAFGPRNTYVSYLNGAPGSKRVLLRKLDPATRSFGAPLEVSQPGSPIFPVLHEDTGGNVHSLWSQDGEVRYRTSTDGVTLNPEQTIATGNFFDPDAAAGDDGKGYAVWSEDTGDNGAVRAVPLDAAASGAGGPPAETCPPVKFGIAKAIAKQGCFKERASQKGVWDATGEIRVNGVDLVPAGAGGAKAAGAVTTTINQKARTLKTNGAMAVQVGKVVLGEESVKWTVGANGSTNVADYASTDKFQVRVLGLPVSGAAELTLSSAKAKVDANLKLPGFFNENTAKVLLKANSQGIDLKDFAMSVPAWDIGALSALPFKLEYLNDNPFTFRGEGNFALPGGALGIHGSFLVEDGIFKNVHAELPFTPPLVVATNVFLNHIEFDFADRNPNASPPSPRTMTGGVGLVAGTPSGPGAPAPVAVDGKLRYEFADFGPAVLSVLADVYVVGLKIGDGSVRYSSNGKFDFDGNLNLKLDDSLGASGVFEGHVDLKSGWFSFSSTADVCLLLACAESTFAGNTKGIGTCVSVGITDEDGGGVISVSVGFTYLWDPPKLSPYLVACDLAELKEDGQAKVKAAGAAAGVDLPAGAKGAIIVTGTSGSPRVRVTAPGGETLVGPSDQSKARANGRFTIFYRPGAKQTYIYVNEPEAGRYTIDPEPGSSPIAKVATAGDRPAVSATAKVGGKGRRRTLSYLVDAKSGETVTFAEQSAASGVRLIGESRPTGKATLKFAPGPGPAGMRDIVAMVERDGVPIQQDVVARYRAPGPPRPGRVSRPRARLRGSTLTITWTGGRQATAFDVRAALRKDGRVVRRVQKGRKLVLRGVEAPDTLTVRVVPVRRVEATRGAASSAKVKIKRPKRKRR